MNYLLDTHTVLWVASNSSRLSDHAKEIILSRGNQCYVSVASAWEIAIKCSLNKDLLQGGVREFSQIVFANGFEFVPITSTSLEIVETLPFHHRDPFDRMLVAVAIAEDMTILSADSNIWQYNVKRVW